MKNTTHRMLRRACAGAVLVSFAPLLLAQNTSSPPASASPQDQGAPTPPPAAALTNDQASYLFGLTLGEQLHAIGIPDVQLDAVSRGVKDAMAGKKSTTADKQQLNEYARAAVQAAGARNKTAGQEFLAKNGKEKGVQTTASGLEYKVIKAGDSKVPLIGPTDEVVVNYRGKLIDGTEFDSSFKRGEPAEFPVSRVIAGWTEGVQLMVEGDKARFWIPESLAYRGQRAPFGMLVFDIELIKIQ